MSGLLTRTIMGAQADIPVYWTKYSESTRTCIQGEKKKKQYKKMFYDCL